ncbi:MAG: methyltransferase domain-containing protein [Ignavibacteria bacterium]|nr:methyltransferase domain-containing protein [Ignavibacteria bacterium]
MVQTTDIESDQQASAFYDKLAPDYDTMTGFEKRFVLERPFFRVLVERYAIGSAIDAGCGTGFHSILLAQLGVRVTAVDVSRKMLERTKLHADTLHVKLRTVESDFLRLPGRVDKKFDAVFSMGNTLAHILSRSELLSSLQSFAHVLQADGVLFLQTLNYDRILRTREQIQSVKEQDGVTFVRYYQFEAATVRFNILKITKSPDGLQHTLNSIELRPILRDEILPLLEEAGFTEIRTYGGISMDEFVPESSKDLVLLATK